MGIADRPEAGDDYWRRIFDAEPEAVMDEVKAKCIEDTRILGCIVERAGLTKFRNAASDVGSSKVIVANAVDKINM